MYSRDELFLCSLECYFGFYINKHQNNTLLTAQAVRHSSTYIILYVLCTGLCICDEKNIVWNLDDA